jgi:ATP phosphoribosyltransferase regulatory subunit
LIADAAAEMPFLAHYELGERARARVERATAAIAATFAQAGYAHVPLPIIQPADLYLDMAGEDVRDRMFLFEDPLGAALCLRADLTIPLCWRAIDEGMALPARLASSGPVFRFEPAESRLPAETIQAGAENLGEKDTLEADVEILRLARNGVGAGHDGPVRLELGDLGLFAALISDLKLEEVWARRFLYAFRHPSLLAPLVAEIREGAALKPPPLLASATRTDAERYVMGKLKIEASETVGGRSVQEIAERLLDKVKLARSNRPSSDDLTHIGAFLAIDGPAEIGLARLQALAAHNGRLAGALAGLGARLARARVHLQSGDEIQISTTLGRGFLYYTGLVFDIRAAQLALPVAAGGRYDRMMQELGAPMPTPAVGCALWPERLVAAGGTP